MAIKHIGDHAKDGKFFTPEQTLNNALEDVGKRGAFKNGKKMLILCLDETDGEYSVSFHQCGMKMSECIALCEISKSQFKELMGY